MIEFAPAVGRLGLCSDLLTRAALDLRARGLGMWPPEIMREALLRQLAPESGWFLGVQEGVPVVTFCLIDEDPDVWPDAQAGEALSLHRLAVHPEWQGRGFSRGALDHAVQVTRQRGRPFLRLDTGADREKLLSLYMGYGFQPRGVRTLRPYTSARFELPVSPTASGHT